MRQIQLEIKRITFKKGRVAAITATARKLAIIIWNMITKIQPYNINEVQINNEKYKKMKLRQIQRNISNLQLKRDELTKLFERASLLTQ
jgi:transposase